MSGNESFYTEITRSYGANATIVLRNLTGWIKKNILKKESFHDDRTWTYGKLETYGNQVGLSVRQVKRAIDKLVEGGVLLRGNYNETAYLRTCWYALKNEEILLKEEIRKRAAMPFYKKVKSILEPVTAEEQGSNSSPEPFYPTVKSNLPECTNPNDQTEITYNTNRVNNNSKEGEREEDAPTPDLNKNSGKKPNPRVNVETFKTITERQDKFFGGLLEFQGQNPNLYPIGMYNEFYKHWIQVNKTGTLMKFEAQYWWTDESRLEIWWNDTRETKREQLWKEHYKEMRRREEVERRRNNVR